MHSFIQQIFIGHHLRARQWSSTAVKVWLFWMIESDLSLGKEVSTIELRYSLKKISNTFRLRPQKLNPFPRSFIYSWEQTRQPSENEPPSSGADFISPCWLWETGQTFGKGLKVKTVYLAPGAEERAGGGSEAPPQGSSMGAWVLSPSSHSYISKCAHSISSPELASALCGKSFWLLAPNVGAGKGAQVFPRRPRKYSKCNW